MNLRKNNSRWLQWVSRSLCLIDQPRGIQHWCLRGVLKVSSLKSKALWFSTRTGAWMGFATIASALTYQTPTLPHTLTISLNTPWVAPLEWWKMATREVEVLPGLTTPSSCKVSAKILAESLSKQKSNVTRWAQLFTATEQKSMLQEEPQKASQSFNPLCKEVSINGWIERLWARVSRLTSKTISRWQDTSSSY